MLKVKKDVSSPYFVELCRSAEADSLLQGELDGLLSPEEISLFQALKTDKRRKDWLAGRIAAKRALRRAILQEQGAGLEFGRIEILNKTSGQPYCRLPKEIKAPQFSISHCSSGGLCGAAKAGGRIGVDWELLALQTEKIFAYYAHRSERPENNPSAEFQMKLWTAKEAVFKLLGADLGFDLKEIRLPRGCAQLEFHGRALLRWRQLGAPLIKLDHRVEAQTMITVAYA